MFDIYKNIENENSLRNKRCYIYVYVYVYRDERNERERETLPLSSSFNILSCNLFSHLDSFLSFARFEVSRTRARRKTATVVHIFLFPRASQGIVVGHTWRVRNTKRDGAYFVRDKKKKVFAHYYVYTPATRISHFKLPLFKNLLFKITLFGTREQLAKATSFHHGRNGNKTHCEKH